MKIAIQEHPTRGHEVIQILESLGGKNTYGLSGNGEDYEYYYHINSCGRVEVSSKYNLHNCKFYTLEEFEKEFPFKVGDKVITINDIIGIIDEFKPEEDYPYCIRADDGIFYWHVTFTLKPYKEMKEERNITLTLEKAKEWYNKGGELKEIALQAFTEKELTKVDLPKTWEEFCKNYPIKDVEYYINEISDTIKYNIDYFSSDRDKIVDKNVCPSKKSAEAHLALIQLEQLRDCYRGLFVTVTEMPVWCIIRHNGRLVISPRTWGMNETFLSFQSKKVAKEYLKNFKPLIEKAGDLI